MGKAKTFSMIGWMPSVLPIMHDSPMAQADPFCWEKAFASPLSNVVAILC